MGTEICLAILAMISKFFISPCKAPQIGDMDPLGTGGTHFWATATTQMNILPHRQIRLGVSLLPPLMSIAGKMIIFII